MIVSHHTALRLDLCSEYTCSEGVFDSREWGGVVLVRVLRRSSSATSVLFGLISALVEPVSHVLLVLLLRTCFDPTCWYFHRVYPCSVPIDVHPGFPGYGGVLSSS